MSENPFVYSADLQKEFLGSLLIKIHRHRVPGVIHAEKGRVRKRLFVKDGSVVYASSTDRTDRLGPYLESQGIISTGTLARLTDLRRTSSKKFGLLLMDEGILSPGEIKQAIQAQVERIAWSIFAWRQGTARFELHELRERNLIRIQVPILHMVLRGTRTGCDENQALKALGGSDSVLVAGYDLEETIDIALDRDEYKLLSRVDGISSVDALCVDSSLPTNQAVRLLYAFKVLGLVHEQHPEGSARRILLKSADPGPEENPPVLLENAPAVEPGEDLVGFYQLPGYGDWDPSPVVYVSFALFFAMIIADAAYGAILGMIAFFLWSKMGASASGRRGRRMLAFISVACVVYGVMVGSYFGVTPPPESFPGRLQVLDATDFGSMMPISIGIGVLQLALANLVTAWGRRRSLSGLAPVGWALALLGGFAAYIGLVQGGVAALGVGLGLVFLFTSERPVKRALDVPLRVVDGVMALTGVSKAFGDVLSYLRLFALGLSSASLALTFNQLGTDVMGAGHGIALLLGLLVLVMGHGLNFVLGIVSGVVHGLRLNVIELYNWSVFGEGVPFQAFARRAEARDGSDGR